MWSDQEGEQQVHCWCCAAVEIQRRETVFRGEEISAGLSEGQAIGGKKSSRRVEKQKEQT